MSGREVEIARVLTVACYRMPRQFRFLPQFLIFNFSLLIFNSTQAQVANDDLENRRVVRAEESVSSTTTGCTVQWNCVDESLTGKCIQYHNDQWFEFTPAVAGRYFVNIGGQQCRDVRGVQLVVLTGTPCQPATYRVLSCTSLGSQDDVFVTLDSLQAGQPYLLNVDGYLRDFCRFNLAVSTEPRGLPALEAPAPAAPQLNAVVTLRWNLPDSLGAVPQFRVWRRASTDFRAATRDTVPVTRTTLGAATTGYTWRETLTQPGTYLYQVVAEPDQGPPVVVQQQWYSYSALKPRPAASAADTEKNRQQLTQWEKQAARMRRRHPVR